MDILSSEHNKTATTMRERVRRRLRRQQTHAEAAMYFLVSTIIYSSTGRILYANAEDAAYGSSSSYGSSGYASGSSSSGSSSGSSGSSGSSSSSSNSASTSTTKGQLVVQPFCKKTNVRVTAVYLTCDSPGAYYYGSGNYRNSLVCMSDDKVNLRVEFYVSPYFTGDSIYTSIELGLYDIFQNVTSKTDLCNTLSPIASDGSSRTCPESGNYVTETYYTVPSIRDYGFHYTPDVRLTYTDEMGNRLGCATAGTVAMHVTADHKAAQGMLALGISCIAFVLVFALLLYLSHRRRKRLEQLTAHKTSRYRYFRTLPSGQVIPLPSGGQSVQSQEQNQQSLQQQKNHQGYRNPLQLARVSSSGSGVSLGGDSTSTTSTGARMHHPINNPAYNETQLPTRPII